jgi:hypothetical protein
MQPQLGMIEWSGAMLPLGNLSKHRCVRLRSKIKPDLLTPYPHPYFNFIPYYTYRQIDITSRDTDVAKVKMVKKTIDYDAVPNPDLCIVYMYNGFVRLEG